jgi:hypothetical protein
MSLSNTLRALGIGLVLALAAGCQGAKSTCQEHEYSAGFERIGVLRSTDGLTFSREGGARVPMAGIRTTDPHPIRLRAVGYLMVYTVHQPGTFADERSRLAPIEIHVAASPDAARWTTDPTPIGYGSVPGLVEAMDGTLYVYYVDVSYGGRR